MSATNSIVWGSQSRVHFRHPNFFAHHLLVSENVALLYIFLLPVGNSVVNFCGLPSFLRR